MAMSRPVISSLFVLLNNFLALLLLLTVTSSTGTVAKQLPLFTYVQSEAYGNHFKLRYDQGNKLPPGPTSVPVHAKTMVKNGWLLQKIISKPIIPDEVAAYLAGVLETKAALPYVHAHWNNTYANVCPASTADCQQLETVLQKQLDYVMDVATQSTNDADKQLLLILWQLKGISDAFWQREIDDTSVLTHHFLRTLRRDVMGPYLLSISEDLPQLTALYNMKSLSGILQQLRITANAIVHISSKGYLKELFFTHLTRTDYRQMLRVYKTYNHPWVYQYGADSGKLLPGANISYSSYPGALPSLDHYYATPELLVMQSANEDMYSKVRQLDSGFGKNDESERCEKTVPTGIRALAANRLAQSAKDWNGQFSQYNFYLSTGTWLTLDKRLFDIRRARVRRGGFYVTESIHGLGFSNDKSAELNKNKLWTQFGVPYYQDVYESLGYDEMKRIYGNYFSYAGSPIGRMMVRDLSHSQDIIDYYKAVRKNEYKTDELAKCTCKPPYSASLSISPRGDLNSQEGQYSGQPWLGFRFSGAIDFKNTMMSNPDGVLLQSGLTNFRVEEFSWSNFSRQPPAMHPDKEHNQALFHKLDKLAVLSAPAGWMQALVNCSKHA